MKRLVLVLGDQLSPDLSSLKAADPNNDIVVMGELADETTYVRHHKKKIAFIFSAMRHFADGLRAQGWTVRYQKLDDPDAAESFLALVKCALDKTGAETVLVTEPGEWRLRQAMDDWADVLGVPVEILPDDRFLCSHADFASWADGRKALRMEYFYREMRRKTGLLMEGDNPAGGQWNFDKDNRKPARPDMFMPQPPRFEPDDTTQEVLDLVANRFADHMGAQAPFWFAVTREQALEALDAFVADALPRFGDYQDAMLEGERFLYHSVLSAYINVGLLDPLEVCQRAEAAYANGDAPINAVEGFIRQIIGWREFVRGIYWLKGPDYVRSNHLGATRDLPDFYWTGKTHMACMRAAIGQTLDEAYAHHIQRLMVTGNFALIAGIDPHQVHEWYLAVYADAFEWVEAPNTVGMSQYADGGVVGSKPYASSGAYINRMSDHCRGCTYAVSNKTEPDACPFNSLYWDFMIRNRDQLESTGRVSRVYQNWDRIDANKQSAYRARAKALLEKLDNGEMV